MHNIETNQKQKKGRTNIEIIQRNDEKFNFDPPSWILKKQTNIKERTQKKQ
jgi:hypothetical protein